MHHAKPLRIEYIDKTKLFAVSTAADTKLLFAKYVIKGSALKQEKDPATKDSRVKHE